MIYHYYQMFSDNRTRLQAVSRVCIYITYYIEETYILITDIWRFGVEILTPGYSLELSQASICRINYISYLFYGIHAFTFFLEMSTNIFVVDLIIIVLKFYKLQSLKIFLLEIDNNNVQYSFLKVILSNK